MPAGLESMVTPSRARAIAALTLTFASTLALGACNNPKNWLESPTEGVKYFVGYEPDMHSQLEFGSELLIGQPERMAYAPLLPKEMLDKTGSGEFRTPEKSTDGDPAPPPETPVSYYAQNAKGEWRLCRLETWVSRTEERNDQQVARIRTFLKSQRPGNPMVAKWGERKYGYRTDVYLFDVKGRLIENIDVRTREAGPEIAGRRCFRYDDKDSVLLYAEPKFTKVCPRGEPDVRDDWTKVENGWRDGQRIQTRVDKNMANDDGGWYRIIDFRLADGLGGGAVKANSKIGIEKIVGAAGLSPRDDDKVNVGPRDADGAALKPTEYYFTKPPVPVELIDHLDTIYHYERRRELVLGPSFRWVEWFAAGKTVATDAYLLGGGYVIRHEQRAPDGKLKRAINVGFESDVGKADAMYPEAPYKKPLLLKGHDYLYRVWDYDAKEKATLVAIGWRRGFDKKAIERADINFGTPDGKEKWYGREEFFKAFGFDEKAAGAHLGRE